MGGKECGRSSSSPASASWPSTRPAAPRRRRSLDEFLDACEQYFGGGSCRAAVPAATARGDDAGLPHARPRRRVHAAVPARAAPARGRTRRPRRRSSSRRTRRSSRRSARRVEDEWVPEMQRILGLETRELPVIWDLDFLHGPRHAATTPTSSARSTSARPSPSPKSRCPASRGRRSTEFASVDGRRARNGC